MSSTVPTRWKTASFIPGQSHDTFGRVYSQIDQERFAQAFRDWPQELREKITGEIVAIDGKTLRRSLPLGWTFPTKDAGLRLMRLGKGQHLAYCTNIHRGETWTEVFEALRRYALAVRDRVSDGAEFAIGLRIGDAASRELAHPGALAEFKEWLRREKCYVFTINGFPYGQFHGTRVKEQVYRPDWSSEARLDYTIRLFEILAALLPEGVSGSVSTLPCSFKEFAPEEGILRRNLWRCVDRIAELSEQTGQDLHLGLEPEPLGWLETTDETVAFFERMQGDRPGDVRLRRHLGVNYDACHLAVEYEDAAVALERFSAAGIRISKLHLSSALTLLPNSKGRAEMQKFVEEVYLHQVVARTESKGLRRYRDLPDALACGRMDEQEWRVHFHVPLHWEGSESLLSTREHLEGVLDVLAAEPSLCAHLEMETYTWEVLPADLRSADVVEQLAREYAWTLGALADRGLR